MKWVTGGESRIIFVLLALLLSILACSGPGLLPTATPLPRPAELATTPLPEGSQSGGLEGVFISSVSVEGEQDSRCYKLYRFYVDGLVLYTDNTCFNAEANNESWSEIESWFQRENPQISSGDYYILDHRLWIRIVTYDAIHQTTHLRTFLGEFCHQKMVLQEPAVRGYSGIPSALTQPVLEYNLLETTFQETDKSGLPDPGVERCSVAGFKIINRPSIALADNRGSFEILTNRDQECSLQYTDPAGMQIEAQGTGTITADAKGICRWEWELGALEGTGTVTITIDEITQDFNLEIR